MKTSGLPIVPGLTQDETVESAWAKVDEGDGGGACSTATSVVSKKAERNLLETIK